MSTDPPPPPIQEMPAPKMNVTCPHCQVRLSVHPSQAGSVIACPKCNGRFQLPVPTAQSIPDVTDHVTPSNVQVFASKKIAAGVCGILLGGLGIHKFILGLNTAATIMLVIWLVGLFTGVCLILPLFASVTMNLIGMVEGIIYLTKTDEDFYQTYAIQKKDWF